MYMLAFQWQWLLVLRSQTGPFQSIHIVAELTPYIIDNSWTK